MQTAIISLRWLDGIGARDEPVGTTLLDLVAQNTVDLVEPNERDHPITPSVTIQDTHPKLEQELLIPDTAISPGEIISWGGGGLPMQIPLPAFGQRDPAGLLAIFDRAARPRLMLEEELAPIRHRPRSARAAPLTQRLFVEALLGAPLDARARHGGAEYVITLRELVEWLWPSRRVKRGLSWNRNRDLPRLARAVQAIHGLAIPFEEPPPAWRGRMEGPTVWRPVQFPVASLAGDVLTTRIAIQVLLPNGRNHGSPVDRALLRAVGVRSAPAYRALLGLAFH